MRIGVITHYKKMEENFAFLAEQEQCELLFEVGVMDYAIETGVRMEETLQVDAIISPSVTGAIIQKHVSIPVIPLHVRNYSFIEAFYRARGLGERIAFADISHDLTEKDFQKIRTMLGYDVERYPFDNLDEVADVVARAKGEGRTVIVSTASCMFRQGRKNAMDVVLIEPTEQDMVAAIGIARTFTMLKKKDVEKNRWLNAVVDSPAEGIITVDAEGMVTVANSVAKDSLGFKASDLVGGNIAQLRTRSPLLEEVLTATDTYVVASDGRKQVILSREDIVADSVRLGSVIRISKLDDIQRMEMDARKKARDNGLVARFTFDDIIGGSKTMADIVTKAKRFARTSSNILLYGQSGCGKELFAQSIHNLSESGNGPFVALNCATLPDHLLESELFGYESGAFTGAKKGGSIGLFELAHGGTVFLDEIGDMPMHLQVKLLRVLQEKTVRRIGGNKNIPVNVRIVAATNRNLRQSIHEGTFREDLFYRLNVLSFEIPPLCKRKADIPELVRHFCDAMGGRAERLFPAGSLARLSAYNWPGNVRELRNFIERILALANGDESDAAMLEAEIDELLAQDPLAVANDPERPAAIAVSAPDAGEDGERIVVSVGSLRDMESEIVRELYKRYNGDKKMLERKLDLSTSTVWRKLKDSDMVV